MSSSPPIRLTGLVKAFAHLSAAIGKTGARNAAEALRLAADRGWLLG